MALYKTILAYDGTDFNGFQRQTHGNTVQDAVETALKKLGWQGTSILAAGRTDTGVHASGQVISFSLNWNHPAEKLRNALNATLPKSVSAMEVAEAREGFHPRYDARSRHYTYRLLAAPARDPLKERYAWRVWPQPDLGTLNAASAVLVGEHDFAGFGTAPKPGGSTVREVFEARWHPEEDGSVLRFDYAANAFLYHMVRRTVHLLVETAQRGGGPEDVRQYLMNKRPVQGLAPAAGLVLAQVLY